jgi:protein involved in polysaccharide export with SLBB domain
VTIAGKQELRHPLTIEHAIQQAGGVDMFEGDWNQKVIVYRKDGQRISVSKNEYGSFMLSDGDLVGVPRH